MASAQELVPLIKEAVANVLAENPSENGDVHFALKWVEKEWSNPERPFVPTPEEPEPPEDEKPTISAVDPASMTVGEAADLTVTGTGYTDASVIKADGNPLATTFVSATELSTFAPGPLAAGSVELTVTTGALTSDPYTLTAEDPVGRRRGRE